jgi:predicted  nucleic acid-binding Zn-ribbon protein
VFALETAKTRDLYNSFDKKIDKETYNREFGRLCQDITEIKGNQDKINDNLMGIMKAQQRVLERLKIEVR